MMAEATINPVIHFADAVAPLLDDTYWLGNDTLGWKGVKFPDLKLYQVDVDTLSLENIAGGIYKDLRLGNLALIAIAADAGNILRDSPTFTQRDYYWTGAASQNWDFTILHDMITAGGTPKSRAIFSINSVEAMHLENDNGVVSAAFAGKITLNGDIKTDRWLNQDSNTFVGIGVLGAGNLAHTAGSEGYSNSAFGTNALHNNTTGYYNSAFGRDALHNNTTGYSNSAFGTNALHNNTTGDYNSAFGTSALRNNTTGYSNSAFGRDALRGNTEGYSNSAFGTNALHNNTTGYSNSAFGMSALHNNTTGYSNSAFGTGALYNNTEGIGNTSMGYHAGDNITTGNYNIIIGFDIDAPSATGDYSINIGKLIQGTLPYSDGAYAKIMAKDAGVGEVEIARAAGAADPYFSMGGSQEFKFYNSGITDFAHNVMFSASVDSAAVADQVSIGGYEISAGHRALAFSSEEVVVVEVDESKFSHKLPVRINGVTYNMMLCAT